MSRRAVITGAAGFVGGHLVEHLQRTGDMILACDVQKGTPLVSESGESSDPAQGPTTSDVPFFHWDLAAQTPLDGATRDRVERFRPEVIYHLAAMSVPADCGRDDPTPEAVAVNVEGTRRVLELAASLRCRPRVLFVSSSHVYRPVAPESPVVSESSPVGPAGGYGKTKLAAEHLAEQIRRREGLEVIVARAFQHTGPRQSARMMLPEWASQFAGDGPVEVHTLDAYVDVTDVRDVVRAYRLLAEHGASGAVYNVGSGVSRRTGEVFELLRQMADPRRPVVELRPGRKQDPIADVSRLAECTGWRPEIPIEQTVADTWAYWRAKTPG